MIKQHLENHHNIDRLYGSYLVNTDNVSLALDEVKEFVHNKILTTGELDKNVDFHFVQKEGKTSKNITVDQIRSMQSFLHKTSVISGQKIAIIYEADKMNLNAANSCLKILEDTPIRTQLFLITQNAASILPTIRSRCAKINHHYDSVDAKIIDARFIKPLLKSTSVSDRLSFIKEFASKDRDLWSEFASATEELLAKFTKHMAGVPVDLTAFEQELLSQFKFNNVEKLQVKYDSVKEIIDNTNKFDLDLRSNCVLLIDKFRC